VDLHGQGFSAGEIALVLDMSAYLVNEYLALYHQCDAPEYRTRLKEQIERLSRAPRAKRGAR
jgi:hypothetical protein